MKKKDKLNYTTTHKVLELSAWGLGLLAFAVAVFGMLTLPDTIPTHFNMRGEADSWGSPATLLICPIVNVILLAMISLIAHKVSPSVWNMPFQVAPQRAERVYQEMGNMIFALELEMSAFFLYITVTSYLQTARGIGWMLALWIGLLTYTIIHCCRKAGRINRSEED